MNLPEQKILTEIERIRQHIAKTDRCPLDGGSGAGKSTIAEKLVSLTEVALVRLDDFYQTAIPESELPLKTVEQRLRAE